MGSRKRGQKHPIVGKEVAPEKQPVAAPAPKEGCLRFRFSEMDDQHWPLHELKKSNASKQLFKKLADYEKLTPAEAIDNKMLARYSDPKKLHSTAQKRLATRYERDDIYRFYIQKSEAARLYGFLEGSEFFITWWDPNHDIYPMG